MRLIGKSCKVKTDYMDQPICGVIKRIRIEVKPEVGKSTLVSVDKLSDIMVEVKDN